MCGIYAHVGIMITAREAFTRDLEPFVVADDASQTWNPSARARAAHRSRQRRLADLARSGTAVTRALSACLPCNPSIESIVLPARRRPRWRQARVRR
ncbi:hypothetical protein ACOBQX_07175 [Actinokineospora sp. G85]|uniref:hypothetical protein n=1 Tax=Actinokineospora sp. G85 TaxID=3406626 RepID=UPI003C73415B